MHLTEIFIDGFRSFRQPTTIDLTDMYTGLTNNRIIFVGTNASGKTTLLETVVSLLKAWHGLEDDLYRSLVEEARSVSIGFRGSDSSAALRLEQGKLHKEGTAELPYFIYFPGNRSFFPEEEVEKLDEDWGYTYSFEQGLLHRELEDGFGQLSAEFFAGRTLARSDRGYTLSSAADQSRAIPLERIPAGEKQALILLTIIDKYLRPGSIVLIDEFEVSLHPTAQRRLFHLLSEKLKRNGSQLVLATHSVEIIRLANEAEVFSLDEICGGACQ